MSWFRKKTRRALKRFGIEMSDYPPRDYTREDWELILSVKPYTMTSHARIHALIDAVRHVVKHDVPGAIVECGVWRGGSMMAAAKTLLASGAALRDLYLFDTYEGMPEPGAADFDLHGRHASGKFEAKRVAGLGWCEASLEDVEHNLRSTGYPADRIHFVRGRVEDTIPGVIPDRIALLRLDTDWYSSTLHELRHLYPRLSEGGLLIIDDFGHWQGSRQATEEYFAELGNAAPFLSRIDYTGRLAVKTGTRS